MSIFGKMSPSLLSRLPSQKPPPSPIRLFPKPKYLAQKKSELEAPISPSFHSKFAPIQELNNENSQMNINFDDTDALPLKNPNQENNNIFSLQQYDEPGFYDKFIGPRFDNTGNLIKYSILGKADRFLRKYNQSADNTKRVYDSRASIYSPKGASNFEIETQSRTETAFRRKSRSNNKKTTIVSSGTMIMQANRLRDSAVPKRNIVRLNRNQVNNEIRKVEERIMANSCNDQALLRTLGKKDQLYFNKEERIFRQKEKNDLVWEEQVGYLKRKVPRSKSEHLIETSEDYRLRKEKAQIIDLLKTDQEKYGNKYWYYAIRNNLHEDLEKIGVNFNILRTFQKSSMNFKNNQVEMIRGPSRNGRQEDVYREKVLGMINLRKKEKDEYLQKTMRQNKGKMNFLQPEATLEGTIKGFELKGENKFEMEKHSLENLTEYHNNFFKEKPTDPDNKTEKNNNNTGKEGEEIIAVDYSLKQLFNKTGSDIFPKVISSFSFSNPSGNIILKPLSARLTHDTETFGKMDPYCQIKIGGQVYKTKVAHDAGKYPSWTETFSFRKSESDDLGEIEVWDYDHLSKNDQIGQGAFSLNSIITQGNKTSKWISMSYKGKDAGQVLLEIEFYPDASKEAQQQPSPYGFGAYPQPYPGQMPMYQQPPPMYPPMYQQPPAGYYPPPMPPGGYQQPPPMYQQPPAGYGYQQPPPGPYQQPPGGYQQPPPGPPGGYQQPPPGPYQQPPGGYQQPPGGYQQPPGGYYK